MTLTLLRAGLGLLALGFAGAAAADRYDEPYAEYDYARVIEARPIVESTRVPSQREVCYDEPVEYVEPGRRYGRDPSGGALLGAIIGGALGNTVGSGDGRRAATIAGAAIGGSIGYDRARRSGGYYETPPRVYRDYAQRCDVRTEYREDEEIVGYDVSYEYHGRIYHTRTATHPGRRIRVAVDVEPLE